MDKCLSTFNYGLCLYSVNIMQKYLKKQKIRTKKLLALFQKEKDTFISSQKEGIWVPIPQINSGGYVIKLEGYDVPFNDEWEQKIEYGGFNIEIEDTLWISDIGSLIMFDINRYHEEDIFFMTGDGNKRYSDLRYNVQTGKYLLTIKGYLRKDIHEFPSPNYGFQFSLDRVDEFMNYKNPREDRYEFNIAHI